MGSINTIATCENGLFVTSLMTSVKNPKQFLDLLSNNNMSPVLKLYFLINSFVSIYV